MSTTVNLGWLKDKNGDKFAPKTITTQVISETGEKLEDRLKNTEKVLDKKITSPETAKIGQILEVEEIDKSGKPVKWRTIDAPNNQIQADWNQNDETQLDYVKNKPFYFVYGNRLELMPFSKYEFHYVSPTYTGHHDFGNYSEEGLFTNDDLYIKLNKKYEVNWNGVVYELTGKSFIHDNIEYIYIGNLYFHSSVRRAEVETGEPFLFVGTKYRQLEVICNYNEVSNDYVNLSLHECSDKDEYEVVARYLDEKYIPNNIPKIKSASVGQLLVVLGVDLDGKPTSFGIVDNNFVEKTQYANSFQAGLVKTSTSYGTQMSSEYIQTYPATQSDINSKTHNYRPIVPKQLDYAVKEGLSNNKLSWTDAEKENARNLIGAVSKDDLEVPTQSDWNEEDVNNLGYIRNKPFYYSRELVSSYDLDDNLKATLEEGKIYSVIINGELYTDLLCTKYYWYYNDGATFFLLGATDMSDTSTGSEHGFVLFVNTGNAKVYAVSSDSSKFDFPAWTGKYSYGRQVTRNDKVTILSNDGVLKQLDEKFIPDSIPKVSTASVGQILEVKEIDDEGKPVSWKAVEKDAYHLPVSSFIEYGSENGTESIGEINTPILIQDLSKTNQNTITNIINPNVLEDTWEKGETNFTGYNFIGKVEMYWKKYGIRLSNNLFSGDSLKNNYTLSFIDDYNFEYTFSTNFKFTFITKLNTLDETNATLYPIVGVYITGLDTDEDGVVVNYVSAGVVQTNTLDDVFLDSNIARKTWVNNELNNKITSPTTSEVGQILSVKAVDDTGRPTEWEVIDAPTGSGEDGYSPIATVEQTETGATISIQDKNGTTTAVVNHGEDGKDGKDGKTPYIDEEGFVVCGENNEYPKKVFEYEWKDNYDKINVTAIDYETGILTVDSMPTQITEELSTTVRVFPMLLIEGVTESFQYGFIPEELLNTSESYYAVKVGDSQIKLYNGNNVLNLTDSGNINLTRWKFQVETQRHNGIVSASVGNIEPTHRYKALFYLPYSAHITTALKLTGEINAPTGSANLKGYASQGIQLTKENAVFSFVNNKYESLSMRSVYYGNKYHYKHYPKIYEVDIKKIGNVCKVSATVNYFCEFGTLKNTSIIPMQKVETDIYLQKSCTGFSFTSGNSNFILDGARCEVWDYGEVF